MATSTSSASMLLLDDMENARTIELMLRSSLPGMKFICDKLTTAIAAISVARKENKLVKFASEACDAARESTFEYLQAENTVGRDVYNDAYALASIYYAESLMLQPSNTPDTTLAALAALRAVDLALLRGGVKWTRVAKALIQAATNVTESNSQKVLGDEAPTNSSSSSSSRKRRRVDNRDEYQNNCAHWKAGGKNNQISEIPRVKASDLDNETFRREYLEKQQPVIITGAMSAWAAMGVDKGVDDDDGSHTHTRGGWSDSAYLKQKAGDRLIPVEVYDAKDSTQTYLTDSWEQQVMKVSDYIDDFVCADDHDHDHDHNNNDRENNGGSKRAYLAQYGLFEQIPALKNDFSIPTYCNELLASDTVGDGDDGDEGAGVKDSTLLSFENVQVSAWFGPSKTVSPLHYDPYHNLLAQVVGYKYIRLHDKKHSKRLQPREGPLCNNSQIDLDNIVEEKRKDIDSIPGLQCVLGPGEMLHIPRHCWHYVRSLSTSFSLSFFWGAKLGVAQDKL